MNWYKGPKEHQYANLEGYKTTWGIACSTICTFFVFLINVLTSLNWMKFQFGIKKYFWPELWFFEERNNRREIESWLFFLFSFCFNFLADVALFHLWFLKSMMCILNIQNTHHRLYSQSKFRERTCATEKLGQKN